MTDTSSVPAASTVDFDDRGMPATVSAAKTMTAKAISQAMVNSIARLKHKSVARYQAAVSNGADGTPQLDSQEVVWLIAEFSRAFGKPVIDLAGVPDRANWSTLGTLADLVKGNL